MSNIIPLAEKRELTAEQRRKSELEAALTPAKASEVQKLVATLSASLAFMPSLLDPAAFSAALAKFLVDSNYPLDVLQELYQRAAGPGGFKHMPSIAELIALADEIVAPLRSELSELRHQQWVREERQHRCTAFRSRLVDAIGEAAPSLDHIELAARLVPDLRRARMTNMPDWADFADEDPQACTELCRRLAAIARAEFPDPDSRESEIQQLLVVAAQERERKRWPGVEQQAPDWTLGLPREPRQRPMEPEPIDHSTAMKRVAEGLKNFQPIPLPTEFEPSESFAKAQRALELRNPKRPSEPAKEEQ